jgi:hypothetical protein
MLNEYNLSTSFSNDSYIKLTLYYNVLIEILDDRIYFLVNLSMKINNYQYIYH